MLYTSNEMKETQNEWQSDLYSRLDSWKKELSCLWEESQRHFSNIIESHCNRIAKTINEFQDDACQLQAQLSVVSKERNDLLETVDNLSSKIRLLSSKSHVMQPLQDPGAEEYHDLDSREVGNPEEKVLVDIKEGTRFYADFEADGDFAYSTEAEDPLNREKNFNASVLNEVPHKNDDTVEHVGADEKVIDGNIDGDDLKQGNHKEACSCSSCNEAYLKDRDSVRPECRITFYAAKEISSNASGKLRDESNQLSEAEARKDEKFECEERPCKSNLERGIKSPIEGVLEKVRNHVCKECGKAYTQKVNLKIHIEGVHENLLRHVCGECGFATSRKGHLSRHIEGVHLKIKNHVCRDCGYAAQLQHHLKEHMEFVHNTADKKFQCDQCPFKACVKSRLNTHIRRVHDKLHIV